MTSKTRSNLRPDSLLRDIAAVDQRLRAALDDPRRIDRVRGPWGAHGPYEDFTPKLVPLFERARKVFEQGPIALARDAYAALFAVLALKDVYGFGVTRPASVVVRAEQARYLRAVGEVAPAGQRATRLVQTMHHLKQSLWEAAVVKSCIRLAREGLNARLNQHDRGESDGHALLAAAVAEVLHLQRVSLGSPPQRRDRRGAGKDGSGPGRRPRKEPPAMKS